MSSEEALSPLTSDDQLRTDDVTIIQPTNGKVRRSQRNADGWTRTEERILALLSDGVPHTRKEIHQLLWDDRGPLANIQQHLSNMRKRLRPVGKEIVCELVNRRICYRMVRLLNGVGE